MTAVMARTGQQPIRPAKNVSIVYLGTAEIGHDLEPMFAGFTGTAIELRYDHHWPGTSTTLVVQLPPGWAIVGNDAYLAWSSAGAIWTAQLLAPVIQQVAPGTEIVSTFTFTHPASGRRSEPVVRIRREE